MSAKTFIEQKVKEGYSKDEIQGLYSEYVNLNDTPAKFSAFQRKIREVFLDMKMSPEYEKMLGIFDANNGALIAKNIDISRQKQALQDTNRILTAESRKEFRVQNVIEALTKELIAEIPKIKITGNIPKLKKSENAHFGIMQFTDHHLNELIHGDEVGNEFDFEVASKRLKKLVDESDRVFKSFGITEVLIAFLGDMINSDRRLDETLHKASNRARAVLLACHIYRQVIEDLIKRGYTVKVASVTGNESRIGEWNDTSDIQATDNFDYMIHNILGIMFSEEKKVQFFNSDWKEGVFNFEDFHLLLLHGESVKQEKNIRDLYAKWAQKGILLDYILHGHYHSTMVTDISSRGSSLCGANAYSDKALGLYSRASQNIHVVMKDKSVYSMKVDLQNATGDGYGIVPELEAYNAKSARKLEDKLLVIPLKG